MTERILIPLDGSTLAESALSYVEGLISRLAPGEKIEITLFNVILNFTQQVYAGRGGGIAITLPSQNEKELKQIKDETLDYLNKISEDLKSKSITVICKIAVGENPAEEIIKAEEEVNADLVVMSTHGRTGITRYAIGSVADKVLRGGKVPVLMIRGSKD